MMSIIADVTEETFENTMRCMAEIISIHFDGIWASFGHIKNRN